MRVGDLAHVLAQLPVPQDPNLLIGTASRDDAAVYRLSDDNAVVVTTDFFMPVVDDPFDFGRVAAANALSDVWAMGATPLLALNIVGFPKDKLPLDVLAEILKGGSAVAAEAGIVIGGGHSIDAPEPIYGLAVVGQVHPDRILGNTGARPGDKLILTKPLGLGVLATAIKRGIATPKEVADATALMVTLNRAAGEVFSRHHAAVHALTDVTGFGLLGHLLEMLEATTTSAVLELGAVPFIAAAIAHTEGGAIPGGSRANLAHASARVSFTGAAADDDVRQLLLADAQTSGGLLAAVAPEHLEAIVADLRSAGAPVAAVLGTVTAPDMPGSTRILVT